MFLIKISFFLSFALGNSENFIPANPLVTPVHIQPEWYFLIAYAILRSIPNKLGGCGITSSIHCHPFSMPLFASTFFSRLSIHPLKKVYFWNHINVVLLLTWIGARPVEDPYIFGQILSITYFLFYFIQPNINNYVR